MTSRIAGRRLPEIPWGVSTTGGLGIQFHVGSFHLWDEEPCAPGRDDTSAPAKLPTYGRGE
jgi:hypothetical protein